MVMVYMGGHVSGAHYNPSVTIALYLRGATPKGDVLPYIAAQIFGAWLAASAGRPFANLAIHLKKAVQMALAPIFGILLVARSVVSAALPIPASYRMTAVHGPMSA